MQVGGDISAKEGWRKAVQLIRKGFGEDAQRVCESLGLCDEKTFKLQAMMADKGLNSVKSTSCGRIFDAASAILGIRQASTFEGEASTALMYAAERYVNSHGMTKPTLSPTLSRDGGFLFTQTTELVCGIAGQVLDNEDKGRLAYEFHAALAEMIEMSCREIRQDTGLSTVALSGGVFQNRLLVKLARERLETDGFRVLLHSLIPPNDGGICVGQAAYGALIDM
ncbi:MAG: carbamoyltransferase HypF, partial [Ruminococcus sp.]|nr:carbamoyltransferase HypF [Ruminococcus sp.]